MLINVASSSVISVLLVVTAAAVVGIASADGHLHTSIKSLDSIDALCGYTSYVEACKRVLGAIASPTNTTDVIHTSGTAAFQELHALIGRSDEIAKVASDPNNQQAIQSCKNYIGYAIEDLRAVIVSAPKLQTMSFDLRNWMSGVIADAETCLDELDVALDLRKQMQSFMRNATELMSNALALITGLAEMVEMSGGRNLKEECPTWLPEHDRKLLASGNNAGAKPDVTVAQDGSGDVKTIKEAISRVPKKNAARFTIYVKAGTYQEIVVVPPTAQNVFMYGDGPKKTKVTGAKHNPVPTSETATFSVMGNGFICKGMGFENTAGPKGEQAVALLVHSDKSAFFNCRMDGYQDTLYTQRGLQFYSNCVVSGTVDFIFGSGTALLQNCLIIVRKPGPNQSNMVTADGRSDPAQTTGIVLHGCRIVPEKALMAERFTIKSYLGRPWKAQARTVVMESMIGDLIRPEGWKKWVEAEEGNHRTCYYAEYNNVGPGAATDARVGWAKRTIERNVALSFTVDKFLNGVAWVTATGANVIAGLKG